MQVDPATRNAAIAATFLGGGALTLLLSRVWAARQLEVLAVGAPLTFVATVLVAHNLEGRAQDSALGDDVPREGFLNMHDLIDPNRPLAERVEALHNAEQSHRRELFGHLGSGDRNLPARREFLRSYFDTHGFDDFQHLTTGHCQGLAEVLEPDGAYAERVYRTLVNAGLEDNARGFMRGCPVNTFLHVCIECGLVPRNWVAHRRAFEHNEAEAHLIHRLWRSGNRDVLSEAARGSEAFTDLVDLCSNDELRELATRHYFLVEDHLPLIEEKLIERNCPLGDATFRDLKRFPNYLDSFPRAELYNTVPERETTDFVRFFAGDKFDHLDVWAILEEKRPLSQKPEHVRAYAEVRQVCGLQTSLQELLDYAHICQVDPLILTDEELQTLGFASSQEEFQEAVLTWKIETGNIEVNELTEAQWRERLSALQPPQYHPLMWKIAEKMPRLTFLAYWLMHNEETPRIEGDLDKLPDRPEVTYDYFVANHDHEAKFNE